MFLFHATGIDWLTVIEPQVFWDERGFFMETYSQKAFSEAGIECSFVQDNHSKSKAGVLRWLHFQTEHTQSKLVRVTAGSVYDVAVDLRKESPTFGKYYGLVLSAENKKQLFIPKGFAHGFLTLEDDTEFLYKCDDFYFPEADGGIHYASSELAINWEQYYAGEITVSEKDQKHPRFWDFCLRNPF